MDLRRVWRYQRGNQNPYIDKQRSSKHTHKTKDRVTRTPLKTGGELRCPGRVSSSCSTSGTRRVNLVTNPVLSHEWGKEVFTTSGTYPWSFVTQIFHNGQPSHTHIYYTNIPCDCGQYTRIFSRGTLNCMDVLYCPTPTAEGNITHPCNSIKVPRENFLVINHSHIEYLLYYILIVK
jgi:hypothetical protein